MSDNPESPSEMSQQFSNFTKQELIATDSYKFKKTEKKTALAFSNHNKKIFSKISFCQLMSGCDLVDRGAGDWSQQSTLVVLGKASNLKMFLWHFRKPCSVANIVGLPYATSKRKGLGSPFWD